MLTNVGGEPVDPTRDRPVLVFRTLLGATLAGTASVALVLWGVRLLVTSRAPAPDAVAAGPAFPLLVGGVIASMLLAAGLAWWRLAPLTAMWRRGVFAMISALGTIVSALAATPLHYRFGDVGLLTLAGVAVVGAILALRPRAAAPS